MMTPHILMAAAAFSLGLVAFCAGVWLTLWCGTHTGSEAAAGKLAGYFVVVLSIIGLIVTSYYGARLLFNEENKMMMERKEIVRRDKKQKDHIKESVQRMEEQRR